MVLVLHGRGGSDVQLGQDGARPLHYAAISGDLDVFKEEGLLGFAELLLLKSNSQ